MKPMLARTVGPRFASYPCFVQPKLNGIRALYQDGVWQSRGELIWPQDFFKHLNEQLKLIELKGVILDGEIYRHGWRLQRINEAAAVNATKRGPNKDTSELCYHIFDTVHLTSRFSDRFLDLYNSFPDLPHIKIVPTSFASSWKECEQHFHLYTREGYEGIMLRPDGPYEFGEHMGRNNNLTTFRSKFLWKHKQWLDGEFECVGITQGEGKADIGAGALILAYVSDHVDDLGVHNINTFKVGTGPTDEDRISFMADPPIGKLIRVRYLCLTEDGKPFNPSFIAVMN